MHTNVENYASRQLLSLPYQDSTTIDTEGGLIKLLIMFREMLGRRAKYLNYL